MSNNSPTNSNGQNSNNNNNAKILQNFESLISELVAATSASSRNSAESKLQHAKSDNIVLYMQCLLQLCISSSNTQIRQLCIVLFRQACEPNNSKEEWEQIPTSAYNSLQTALLNALTSEKEKQTYILICDAIGTMASRIIEKGFWNDLLSNLLKLANSNEKNSHHKLGFLRVLDCLAEYAISFLKPNFGNIYSVIQTSLNDNNSDVSLTALKTYVTIIIALNDINDILKWNALIQSCLQLLMKAIETKNEENLTKILESLLDIASNRFFMIEKFLDELMPPIMAIAKENELSFDTKKLALELLVSMSRNNGKVLRKNAKYCKNVIELALYYLSLYDDDVAFNSKEDDFDQDYVWNSKNWISEIATNLGANTFLKIAKPLMQSGLDSLNWKQCYATLNTFIQIMPLLKELDEWKMHEANADDEKNDKLECIWDVLVPKIMQLILNKQSKPQVKHSALLVVKCLVHVYESDFSVKYAGLFYESMVSILRNYRRRNGRVLEQCVKCISHFNRFAERFELQDKCDVILKFLSQFVRANNCDVGLKVRMHSVTCVGTCAQVMREMFFPFYSEYMALMIEMIGNKDLDSKLRGKCMECIGMIGESVGNQLFKNDAHKLMEMLLSNEELKSTLDSTCCNYMNQLFARISRCIGNEFVVYFKLVIPQILKSADLSAARLLLPDEAQPADAQYSVFTVHLRGVGDTKFCINAVSLDEKQWACHMLYQFCKDQSVGFMPFVMECTRVMKQLMRYEYHARVRSAATAIVPLLLKCVVKSKTSDSNYKSILNDLLVPLIEAMLLEPDIVETVPILEVLAQLSVVVGASDSFFEFTSSHLKAIAQSLCSSLTDSRQRYKDRCDSNNMNNNSVNDDDEDECVWANDVEAEVIAHCIDVVEYTLRASGAQFVMHLHKEGVIECAKNAILIDNNKNNENNAKYGNDSDKLQFICLVIDIIELGGDFDRKSLMKWFYPCVCECISDSNCDDDIKQTCIFAIGMFAEIGELKNYDCDSQFLKMFVEQVHIWQNHDDKNELVYDNMVSAIGKILRYKQHSMDANSEKLAVDNWTNCLIPITSDQEEFNSCADNAMYFSNEYCVKNNGRIALCLLFYLSQFRDQKQLTSYDLIMDYSVDLSDGFPKNVPILKKDIIAKIVNFKSKNEKIFEEILNSNELTPKQIQNIQFVIKKNNL